MPDINPVTTMLDLNVLTQSEEEIVTLLKKRDPTIYSIYKKHTLGYSKQI